MAFDIGRIKISYKAREIRYKKKLTKKTIIKYIAQKSVVQLHTLVNDKISCFRIFLHLKGSPTGVSHFKMEEQSFRISHLNCILISILALSTFSD